MGRPTNYNTKQRETIVSYIASVKGTHVTVGCIAEHFKELGVSIGLTTIYRHLDKLVQKGVVKKYILDGFNGACYQYIGEDGQTGGRNYHLKCECCGKLIHLQCDYIEKLSHHFFEKHAFALEPSKTTFYGRCSRCFSQ